MNLNRIVATGIAVKTVLRGLNRLRPEPIFWMHP